MSDLTDKELQQLRATMDKMFDEKQPYYIAKVKAEKALSESSNKLSIAYTAKSKAHILEDQDWSRTSLVIDHNKIIIHKLAVDINNYKIGESIDNKNQTSQEEIDALLEERHNLIQKNKAARAKHAPYVTTFNDAKLALVTAKEEHDNNQILYSIAYYNFQQKKDIFDTARNAFKNREEELRAL
jgi:L-arabinose isomerase